MKKLFQRNGTTSSHSECSMKIPSKTGKMQLPFFVVIHQNDEVHTMMYQKNSLQPNSLDRVFRKMPYKQQQRDSTV